MTYSDVFDEFASLYRLYLAAAPGSDAMIGVVDVMDRADLMNALGHAMRAATAKRAGDDVAVERELGLLIKDLAVVAELREECPFALENIQRIIGARQWRADCPVHSDRDRSLLISVGDDGAFGFECSSPTCAGQMPAYHLIALSMRTKQGAAL